VQYGIFVKSRLGIARCCAGFEQGGSGSIRAEMYGSVLYAMFFRHVLGFATGPGYAIAQ
jgi:hypothetical protein